LRNRGDGTFEDMTVNLPSTSDWTRRLSFADFDHDGDLDLAELVYSWGALRLYRNDGSGRFEDVSNLAEPSALSVGYGMTVDDLDFDGDPDIANDRGPGEVLWDLDTQVAWRAVPRVGRELVIDLCGHAGEAWALYQADAVDPASFGTSGAFALDPSSASLFADGFLDAQGRSSAVFEVPNDPTWIGTARYWQARIGDRWSNVERAVFGGF
jgi:hypothetical protein